MVTHDARVQLQRKIGLEHTPTVMTYHARLAPSGEGPMSYDWQDKPHRVLYGLCAEIERLNAEIDARDEVV